MSCKYCNWPPKGIQVKGGGKTYSMRSAKKGSSVSPVYILLAARNIAEACGETFGSIRNRDLTKWGVSIVPKEASEDFAGCASRIREALGVSDG